MTQNVSDQVAKALREVQTLVDNGIDAERLVALYNQYPADVQREISFTVQVLSLQQSKKTAKNTDDFCRESASDRKALHAEINSVKVAAAVGVGIGSFALALNVDFETAQAVATGVFGGAIVYIGQYLLAVILGRDK